MKTFLTIVITLVIVLLILWFLNKKKQDTQKVTLNNNVNVSQSSTSGLAAAGMSLANLIANTKCGKNGNPPCTTSDLQQAGWSQEQIAQAQAGSNVVKDWSLCYNLGIGC